MMNFLLFTCITFLSINGAAFEVGQSYQEKATPEQRSTAAAAELAEATRLGVEVVKLFAEGKYDEALPLAKRVLEFRERNSTPGDERLATAALNLAEIYNSKKKLSDAQQLFERALRVYEEKYGPDDRRVATTLDRLGYVHFYRLHYSETEDAWNRSLIIKEKVFGSASREVADQLHTIAEFNRHRQNFDAAEALYDRALMIMRTKLALDKQETEKLLEHYSCVYYETGKMEKLKGLSRKYMPEPATDSDKSLQSGSVLNGIALKMPKPEYPAKAKAIRAQGIVVIGVTIDERGKVIEAHDVCSNHPSLAQVSIDAARKAEFTPTKLSGQPVKVKGIITYNFKRH